MIIVRQGKCNSYKLVLSVNNIVVVNTYTLLKRLPPKTNDLADGNLGIAKRFPMAGPPQFRNGVLERSLLQ